MINRKDKILAYIRTNTERLIKENNLDSNGVDALSIAYDLKIDRANVSRELNYLWKSGSLIKVFGRPVFYLDVLAINKAFPSMYIPTYIAKDHTISEYLKDDYSNNNSEQVISLDNMIGANGSLAKEIEKAKAAISYPPYGLPTIITGNIGTEKAELAEAMVHYAIISKKKINSPIFTLDARKASTNPEAFEQSLFGYNDDNEKNNSYRGIIEKCTDGFLILENIELLPKSTLELIVSLLNKKNFSRVNSNTTIPLKCMLILISNLSIDNEILRPITHYTTIRINLEDIDKRGGYEKLELIMNSFSHEARNINMNLKVSKDVIACFANKKYVENITELENDIKNTCSKAYLKAINDNNNVVNVILDDLPQNIYQMTNENINNGTNIQSINIILNVIKNDYLIFDKNGQSADYNYFRQFPLLSATHLQEQFINEFKSENVSITSIDNYIEEIFYTIKNCSPLQLENIYKQINTQVWRELTLTLFKYPQFISLKDHEEILYGLALHLSESQRHKQDENYDKEINNNIIDKDILLVWEQFFSKINPSINANINTYEKYFFARYIELARKYALNCKVSILVIAHGESIATEMVNYVKNNFDTICKIDAINYRDDMQLNDCIELACIKAIELNQGSGVLIYSDREPLTTISDQINKQTNVQCRTIHPLTLDGLVKLAEKTIYSINDFESLSLFNNESYHFANSSRNDFIKNLTDKLISKTCNFIDAYKAVNVLNDCLNKTLAELNIPYSDDIAVKYFCHCVNMLERVIKNEAWENNRLNHFISANSNLMQKVNIGMEYANNTYGIKIPQTELVYVAELLKQYID